MKERTDTFKVLDDDDYVGVAYEFTEFNTFRPVNGSTTRTPGAIVYELADGTHLNPGSEPGTFTAWDSGKRFRRAPG